MCERACAHAFLVLSKLPLAACVCVLSLRSDDKKRAYHIMHVRQMHRKESELTATRCGVYEFRNAGLVWLHTSFEGWSWLSMNMFDFGHSYAAKAGSLMAMFLMALVLFEILPQLHRHIIDLIDKVYPIRQER